ncbi:MAG: hypothetical protein KDI30_05240 [Pseudomonadales bacterium]|nr:hypothetical protein [Pseudomonadales bacterium]
MHNDSADNALTESERKNAFFSALLDDELDQLELRRFLKSAAAADSQSYDKLKRYAFVRAVLHDEISAASPLGVDITSAVSAAIANEKPGMAETAVVLEAGGITGNSKLSASLLPMLGKVAIAASVALVVIAGAQYRSLLQAVPAGVNQASLTVATQETPLVAPDRAEVLNAALLNQAEVSTEVNDFKQLINDVYPQTAARDLAKVSLEYNQRQRINSFLRYHYEQAAANSSRGMIPAARITAVDNLQDDQAR